MGKIKNERKIRVYEDEDNLKIFVGERELAYTVNKKDVKKLDY